MIRDKVPALEFQSAVRNARILGQNAQHGTQQCGFATAAFTNHAHGNPGRHRKRDTVKNARKACITLATGSVPYSSA